MHSSSVQTYECAHTIKAHNVHSYVEQRWERGNGAMIRGVKSKGHGSFQKKSKAFSAVSALFVSRGVAAGQVDTLIGWDLDRVWDKMEFIQYLWVGDHVCDDWLVRVML